MTHRSADMLDATQAFSGLVARRPRRRHLVPRPRHDLIDPPIIVDTRTLRRRATPRSCSRSGDGVCRAGGSAAPRQRAGVRWLSAAERGSAMSTRDGKDRHRRGRARSPSGADPLPRRRPPRTNRRSGSRPGRSVPGDATRRRDRARRGLRSSMGRRSPAAGLGCADRAGPGAREETATWRARLNGVVAHRARILLVSGSLRSASTNTAHLRTPAGLPVAEHIDFRPLRIDRFTPPFQSRRHRSQRAGGRRPARRRSTRFRTPSSSRLRSTQVRFRGRSRTSSTGPSETISFRVRSTRKPVSVAERLSPWCPRRPRRAAHRPRLRPRLGRRGGVGRNRRHRGDGRR